MFLICVNGERGKRCFCLCLLQCLLQTSLVLSVQVRVQVQLFVSLQVLKVHMSAQPETYGRASSDVTGDPVNKNLLFDSSRQHLYIATEKKVTCTPSASIAPLLSIHSSPLPSAERLAVGDLLLLLCLIHQAAAVMSASCCLIIYSSSRRLIRLRYHTSQPLIRSPSRSPLASFPAIRLSLPLSFHLLLAIALAAPR